MDRGQDGGGAAPGGAQGPAGPDQRGTRLYWGQQRNDFVDQMIYMMQWLRNALPLARPVETAWTGVQPDRLTPRQPNRIDFGPADNREVFEALGGAQRVLRSILRHVDIEPFTLQVMENHGLTDHGLMTASFICFLRFNQASSRKQQLILEVFIPRLPKDQILPRDEARNELLLLLNNTNALRDAFWFIDGLNYIRRAGQNAPKGAEVWDMENHRWRQGTTLTERVRLLHIISGLLINGRCRDIAIGTIILAKVAFAVRGTISAAKLTRIIMELTPTIPFIGDVLNIPDLQLTWLNYGHLVDDEDMPKIMLRWLGLIPAYALRLRVVLAQASGSGLTSLDVIARAIHEHPHFPWVLVRRMYPEQWDNAQRAIRLVGNNPYYGYRRDLTDVRSTQFRHLAALCGRLLIALGDRLLERYQGFVEDKVRVHVWRHMIDAYVSARGRKGANIERPMSEEEIDHHADMMQLVAQYPANIEVLARIDGHPDRPDVGLHGGGPQFRGGPRHRVRRDDDDNDGDGGKAGAYNGEEMYGEDHFRHPINQEYAECGAQERPAIETEERPDQACRVAAGQPPADASVAPGASWEVNVNREEAGLKPIVAPHKTSPSEQSVIEIEDNLFVPPPSSPALSTVKLRLITQTPRTPRLALHYTQVANLGPGCNPGQQLQQQQHQQSALQSSYRAPGSSTTRGQRHSSSAFPPQ